MATIGVGTRFTAAFLLAVAGPVVGAVSWGSRIELKHDALKEEVSAWNARQTALQKQMTMNQAEIQKQLQMLSVQQAITGARVDLVVDYLGADKNPHQHPRLRRDK